MMAARRSIFSRLVNGGILLALVLVAALWALTDRTIAGAVERSARAQVDTDLAGLVDVFASGGEAELVRRIEDRLSVIGVDANTPHYLLADDAGRRLAGDLADWPPLDPAVSEARFVAIGAGTSAYARATLLGPGLRLAVAREADAGDALRRRIASTFAAAAFGAVLLAWLAGRRSTGRLRGRIEAVNRAFRAGDPQQLRVGTDATDADEIDELADHSAAALTRMGALVEAYRDMSDQLAHEIRTPLAHLDRQLARALETSPSEPVEARLLAARGDIRRLVGMLESLLDIAASKAGRGDVSRLDEIDLSALVGQVCELYADSAEESGHHFAWSIAPDVRMKGEAMQWTRMVTNLLDNAFKYVPPGGTVDLTLDTGPVLTVADDGPGIAPAERARIFDRFFRGAHADESEETKGSGLGLSLARAIAERHGLELELVEGGKGAAFRVARNGQ